MRLPKNGTEVPVGAAFAFGRMVVVRTGPRAARRIGTAKSNRLAKLFAAAYTRSVRPRTLRQHYEIISPLVPEGPIGCTEGDEGMNDARAEEPDATFRAVKVSACRSCSADSTTKG